ncbi:MAG: YheT family hydrolase [Microcoleaceae cyanobacterium]
MYAPPFALNTGIAMTLYAGLKASQTWESTLREPEPAYSEHIFLGAGNTPIFGIVAIPPNPRGTLVGTYGITGDLDNQWFLRVLGRKAFARGYAVVLFDWRAHGKTAELSPTLTSDGLYEGQDFVHIAAQAKSLGCPAPFWFTGFSLGGQLALWGVQAAQTLAQWGQGLDPALNPTLNITEPELAGGAVICPSLDSTRSLRYLVKHPVGKHLERSIARTLKKLAYRIAAFHPGALDLKAIERVNTIWDFDQELIISTLGFATVEDYYGASSPLPLLPHLQKPTLILYAADDPLFDPAVIPDLQAAAQGNPRIDLRLTAQGGHVGYISSQACQRQMQDPDCWWAWNRVLEWCDRPHDSLQKDSSDSSKLESGIIQLSPVINS